MKNNTFVYTEDDIEKQKRTGEKLETNNPLVHSDGRDLVVIIKDTTLLKIPLSYWLKKYGVQLIITKNENFARLSTNPLILVDNMRLERFYKEYQGIYDCMKLFVNLLNDSDVKILKHKGIIWNSYNHIERGGISVFLDDDIKKQVGIKE